MKKILIAAAAAAAFVTPQAFAQAKNFEGFSIGAGINFASNTTEVTSTIYNGSGTESSQNLDLNAAYTFALSNQFTLGLGVSVGLGDQKAGVLASNSGGSSATVKIKSSTAVFVAPGYALSDSLLVYGKLGALSGTAEAVGTITVPSSITGIGYGAGVRGAINKNVFWTAEYLVNKLNDRSFAANNEVDKGNGSTLTIGLGYKF